MLSLASNQQCQSIAEQRKDVSLIRLFFRSFIQNRRIIEVHWRNHLNFPLESIVILHNWHSPSIACFSGVPKISFWGYRFN